MKLLSTGTAGAACWIFTLSCLLLAPAAQAVTCNFQVNATTFSTCPTSPYPNTIVYTVSSSPSGLEACVGGTGPNSPSSPICVGPTNKTISYTFIQGVDEGAYTRFVEIRNAYGNVVCTADAPDLLVLGCPPDDEDERCRECF